LNSSYQSSDGISHAAADVWFAVAPADSLAPKVGALTQAIASFDAFAAAPINKVPIADLGKNVPTTNPVAGLVQAMQSYSAFNGLGASANTELRYSAAPGAQLAMLAPSHSRNENVFSVLAGSGRLP